MHIFHKWGKWGQDISVIDNRYFVARARVCLKCGLADMRQGYIANVQPKSKPSGKSKNALG